MRVWEDEYIRLEIDPGQQFVRQTRSARVYENLEVLNKSLDGLIAQMQGFDRTAWVLLQDMRASRGRNDPEFEGAITRARPGMSGGFRKLAVLVATHVGRLQVQRHLPSRAARTFLDEQEALAWLRARD